MDGKEAEEDGEAVLAFGHPGDGFDAEGMEGPEEGEEKSDERRVTGDEQRGEAICAWREAASGGRGEGAKAAGETEEEKEEEEGVEGMEEDVGEVEGPWAVAEEGGVENVGEPEDRDIHGGGAPEGEGARGVLRGDGRMDHGIGGDVGAVVEFDQGEADGGEKEKEGNEKGDGGEQKKEGGGEGGKTGFHGGRKDSRENGAGRGKRVDLVGAALGLADWAKVGRGRPSRDGGTWNVALVSGVGQDSGTSASSGKGGNFQSMCYRTTPRGGERKRREDEGHGRGHWISTKNRVLKHDFVDGGRRPG